MAASPAVSRRDGEDRRRI
jgi:choice-of-anchor A domain-containing protein